jgi:hypothetical protein
MFLGPPLIDIADSAAAIRRSAVRLQIHRCGMDMVLTRRPGLFRGQLFRAV